MPEFFEQHRLHDRLRRLLQLLTEQDRVAAAQVCPADVAAFKARPLQRRGLTALQKGHGCGKHRRLVDLREGSRHSGFQTALLLGDLQALAG